MKIRFYTNRIYQNCHFKNKIKVAWLALTKNGRSAHVSCARFYGTSEAYFDKLPEVEDLENSLYRYKGWGLDMRKLFYNFPNIELYDEQYYKKMYLDHIKSIKDYFQNRGNDLVVINVAETGSYQKLAKFLNLNVDENDKFPWLNKT